MDDQISALQKASIRLADHPSDQTIALRLIGEAIKHLATGSDGSTTGIELDLIALTLHAQNLVPEAELLERVAQTLLSGNYRRAILAREAVKGGSPSNVVSFARRRDFRRSR
jgi:hypothetical protein